MTTSCLPLRSPEFGPAATTAPGTVGRVSDVVLQPMTEDHLAAVLALHRRADAHDGRPMVLTPEGLREDLDDDHVVLADDVRLAVVAGELAGYLYAYHLPSDVQLERCYLFGRVDPAFRGRGVGRTLMAWGVERAGERLRSSASALPKVVRVDGPVELDDAHRLFARFGFTPVRWFEELLRPLADLPPRHTVDGVRIVPWPADRDDEIRHEKDTAFEDHWGSTPTTAARWHQIVHGVGSRTDLSRVALDVHDRVVAHCLCKRFPDDDDLLGRRDGWIDNLGTLREWRGRGIASALIIEALHAFAAEGLTHASIEVDADSPTGAARLYRALGFEPIRRAVVSELVLDR